MIAFEHIAIKQAVPIARARRRAACAEDALVEAVEELSFLGGLGVLHLLTVRANRLRLLALQPRLDALVLRVEVRQVRHQIFQHVPGAVERVRCRGGGARRER